MEAKVLQSLLVCNLTEMETIGRRPSGSIRFNHQRVWNQQRLQASICLPTNRASNKQRPNALDVSCSYKNFPAPIFESQSSHDDHMILKNKAQEIEPYLSGRCIYLVGMMGSGKTTVGKVLSQVLSYSFCDSDSLVEQEVNGTPVSDIFQLYGEGFFRDKEVCTIYDDKNSPFKTQILHKLSRMHLIVVSTGGGAVMRPINWKYMHSGISVWLDVPLEALAKRISAVGTKSRPLLHNGSEDAYRDVYKRLSTLMEERSDAYANANARVSLENMVAKLGYMDVTSLSPVDIAIEVLGQIKNYLRDEGRASFGTL